jgi:signal transduction histidine kinase
VLVPGLSLLSVVFAPPDDVWSREHTPVDSLLRFTGRTHPNHRVRVTGVITMQRPGASVFLQSAEQGIFVQTTTLQMFEPGDVVDVAGFVAPGDYTPILRYSDVRKSVFKQQVQPHRMTAREGRAGAYDAHLVEIEGTVIDVRRSGGEEVLVMRSDGLTFDAYLRPGPGAAVALLSAPVGSYVRVTGVCSVKVNPQRIPQSFRIVLRSQQDLAILKRAPWPQERVLMALAGVALAALLAGAWVLLLRRKVRQQTLALQRQLTEIETIYQTAHVGLCFVDADLRYVRVNEQMSSVLAVLAPLLEPMFRRVLETGEPIVNREVSCERTWLVSHYPVKSAKMLGVSSVIQDITELKFTEAQLLKHANDLAVSNAELQQFAYIASHDLQEPLRTVAIYSQMLTSRCKGDLTPDARQYLGFISEAATRMQALIRDLLIYGRLIGAEDGEPRPASIGVALDSALKNLEAAIRDSGATIHCDALPPLLVDQTQFLQVFQNLISNAIVYRGDRRPEIRISAKRHDGQWIFSVADNGLGIDPRYHERIFGVFKRLNRQTPGTGIGLAICKKIVEQQGGRIWVESAEGQGSIFRFSVPATTVLSVAS